MEFLRKISAYLSFKRQTGAHEGSFNLKAMHTINRISIFVFLAGLIVLAVRMLR